MNVVILTQDTPAYVPLTLRRLLPLFETSGIKTVGYMALPLFSRRGFFAELFDWYKFYGPVAFVRMSAYCTMNRFLGMLGMRSTLNRIIKSAGIRILDFADVNGDEFANFVKENEVDVVISIAFPQRITEKLIEAPRICCINFHDGLLPEYRGRLPLFWAMLKGESEVGLTVHEIDPEFDNGPILVQERLAIDPGESLHNLFLRVAVRAPELLVEALGKLKTSDGTRLPNPVERSSYYSFPRPKHGRQFRLQGNRFFV